MKKLLLLIGALGLFTYANAQISVGPRAGINLYEYNIDRPADVEAYRIGYQFGAYLKIDITDKIMFMPELTYSRKHSYKSKSVESLVENRLWIEMTQEYSYIDIPLIVGFGDRFRFLIGLETSFLLSAEELTVVKDIDYEVINEETIDVKDITKRADFNPVIGFEHELKFGLNYGMRVAVSPINISKIDDQLNKIGLQFVLGYSFKFD